MSCRIASRLVLCVALPWGLLPPAQADLVKKQVLVSVPYEGTGLFGGKVPQEAHKEAVLAGREKALALYASDCAPARQQLLAQIAPLLQARISEVVPELQVLNERIDKERKQLEISATAAVDVGKIDAVLNSQHAASASAPQPPPERPPMVFVFIARSICALTTSDGKRVEFVKTSKSGGESERPAASSGALSVEYNMEDLQVKEWGGKNIDKAQSVEWGVEPVSGVDTAVNEVFTQSGYECTDPADVEGFNLQAFRDDYASGDDVRPETRQQANKLLREYEVGYFATGRMDITLPTKDPVSGLTRASVKVEASVIDLRGKLPKKVAAVSGEYYNGAGESVQVAVQNALLAAARAAATKLTDQLRAKGL